MRRALALLLMLGAGGVAACIIGPKQDDPAGYEVPADDVGILADTAPVDFGTADSGVSADTESPPFTMDSDGGDARSDGDAKTDGDALTDAVTEGG